MLFGWLDTRKKRTDLKRGSRDGDILVTDTPDHALVGFRRTFGHGRFKVQCDVSSKCGRGRLRPGKGKEETAHWARTTDGRTDGAGRTRSAASRIEGCRIARPPAHRVGAMGRAIPTRCRQAGAGGRLITLEWDDDLSVVAEPKLGERSLLPPD